MPMDNNTLPESHLRLSQDERKQLAIILSSGGFAGMLSCSMALALLVFFKMYKHFSERLSLYLLLSGLFVTLVLCSMIVGAPLDFVHHHSLCQAIGFFLQYSIWTLLLFTTFITFNLASLVFFHKMSDKLELFYILFTLIFPLLFSWIPFLTDSYGLSGGWCWIKSNSSYSPFEEGAIEQFTLWFGPLFVIQIGNSVVMVAISVVLCRKSFRKADHLKVAISEQTVKNETNTFEKVSNEAPNHHYKEALKRNLPLLLYPIIYTIFHWFPIVNRMRTAISPSSSFDIWVIHSLNSAAFIFLLGIIFIIYVIVKKKLTKQNIKKAAHSWKHTFARMRRSSYAQFHDQHPTVIHSGTDVFTTEGYITVTNPTTWEPDRESAYTSCSQEQTFR